MSKKTVRRGKTLQKTEKQEAAISAAETEPRPAARSQMLSLTLFEIGEIENMKRAQLQKLCKKVGLKASGKNTELISRLQEYHKDAGISRGTEEQSLMPKFTNVVGGMRGNDKEPLNNATFEIVDSEIPLDQHVHVNNSTSMITCERMTSNHLVDCACPDSTAGADDKSVQSSRGILKELNHENVTVINPLQGQAQVNACGKWCVVEGLLKQDNKLLWKKIHLVGGKPTISNSFGKRIPFVLEPCGLATPENCDDNFICGTCVKDNETMFGCQGISQVEHTVSMQQDLTNSVLLESETGITCSTPSSSNHSLLSSHSRVGSVKRKRIGDANSSFTDSIIDSDQMVKKRRKDNVSRSASGTPASPQVRRARGEQLVLPRNLQKPWHPKKTAKPSKAAIKEDTEFAKRVEEIIKNTQPGSEEEMAMILFSKSNKIQRSPKKNPQD